LKATGKGCCGIQETAEGKRTAIAHGHLKEKERRRGENPKGNSGEVR
jgi:hypothetical protein